MKKTFLLLTVFLACAFPGSRVSLAECLSGDCENGRGVYRFPTDGSIYRGEFRYGGCNGVGERIFTDDSRYQGQFKNNNYNGQGTEIFANGLRYTGGFVNNQWEGQGTKTFPDGRQIRGIFKESQLIAGDAGNAVHEAGPSAWPARVPGPVLGRHSIKDIGVSPAGLSLLVVPDADAYIVLHFSRRLEKDHKVIVHYGAMENIIAKAMYLGYRGKPFSEERMAPLVSGWSHWGTQLGDSMDPPGDPVDFEAVLPAGDYESIRLDFDAHNPYGMVSLVGIEVVPLSFWDREPWMFGVAFLIGCMLLVPGILLAGLYFRRDLTRDRLLVYAGFFSVVFYVVLYLCFEGLRLYGVAGPRQTAACFVFLLACLFWLARRTAAPTWRVVKQGRREFLAYFVLFFLSVGIITVGKYQPFRAVNYSSISGPKTFHAFRAHDNMFQFVNGKAIAEEIPFNQFYRDKKLVMDVQDRGILPGVLYAMFRKVLKAGVSSIGNSYLSYTMVGTALNLLVLFPLAVLFRRYWGDRHLALFFFVLSAHSFVLVNYYFSYFKFAGASFFLAALAALLLDRQRMASWIFAGAAFSVGASMHGGNALAVPTFFLWLCFLHARESGWLSLRTWLFPSLLVTAFLLVHLPWSIVKALHFPDTGVLFKLHYLDARGMRAGTLEAVRIFFREVPWQEQLSIRWQAVLEAFRLQELVEVAQHFAARRWRDGLLAWSQKEFAFVLVSLYGLLAVAGLVFLWRIFLRLSGKKTIVEDVPAPRREWTTIAVLCPLTIFSLIWMHYSRTTHYAPDIAWVSPLGITLLLHMGLIGYIVRAGRWWRVVLSGYALMAVLRLIVGYVMTYDWF